MEVQPWTTGVALLALCCLCRVNSNILSTMLDAPQAIDDEELKEILNIIEVPHSFHAVKMDNGRENMTSMRRIQTLKTLTTTSTEGEGYTEALINIDALEDSEKKYQKRMRQIRRKLRRQNKKNNKNKNIRKKRFTFDNEINPELMWPNGVINFQFDSSLNDDEKANILYVMQMYDYYTPISFAETSEGSNLLFGRFSGCWSYVGNRGWDTQRISPCAGNEATIIHEIGHAIGLHHEHQNPAATSYLWPNDVALTEDWIQWFYPVVGNYYRYYDHVFDLDSPMMYSPWDASKSRTNLDSLVVFDEEHLHAVGNRGDRQTMYYMFKEISELYGVASEMCTDLVCDFDGYPAYMDDVCMCDCPTGLDPFTDPGCTAIEVEDTSGESRDWPQNVGLIKSSVNGISGCPSGFVGDGWIRIEGGPSELEYDSIYNFNGAIESGSTVGEMSMHFCVRNNLFPFNSEIAWPKGSYCYIKDGQSCAAGFVEGTKKFNNGGAFSWYGNVPSGINSTGNNMFITWCCRNDAHHTVPTLFPIDEPFILFPSAGKCQVVKGMDGAWQMLKYYNNGDDSDLDPEGLLPTMNIDSNGDVILNLCFYTRITTNCGGLYYLDVSNRQVTFNTPDYPQNYPSSVRCTWAFKTEPGNFFKLEFHDFDIATNPDGTTDDEVEIRNFKIGNNGVRYTGQGIARHHISEENYLSVIFYSSKDNSARGFNAIVTLVDADTTCYSGKGENYDGKRNVTMYFKPCLNWKDAADKGCPHHPYAIGDEFDSLNHNYCRNPGHGVRPWCYVDYNDACYREYCDVCNMRGCFDGDNGQCDVNLSKIRWCELNKDDCKATCNCDDCAYTDARPDCQETVEKLPKFCDKTEGQTYCAETCGICDRMLEEPLVRTCSPPSIHDAEVVNEKPSYNLGEVVELRCRYGNGTHSQTCSSTGNWVPRLDYVCDAQCPDGYKLVGGKCYKVYKQVEFEEGKQLCAADSAQMLTMKSDSSAIVSALYEQFSDIGVYHLWLDLIDSASNDQFVWGDGTALTYTNWRSAPLKLPDECRQKYVSNTFSTRSMTKTGKPCLYWNSTEVQGISSVPSFPDNYCRVFDRGTPNLYCYFVNSDGDILVEDCDHLPFCYDNYTAATTPFPREFNRSYSEYTGHLNYAYFGQSKCLYWKDFNSFTDADFPENSKEDAQNFCRRPLSDTEEISFRIGQAVNMCDPSSKKGPSWNSVHQLDENGSMIVQGCNDPATCSENYAECRTYRRFYGGKERVHYAGTVSRNNLGNECKKWTDTGYRNNNYFPSDGYSASAASNYCRPLFDIRPWCFDVTGSWAFCPITEECCFEKGYIRPSDYTGTRSFSWNEEKCQRWDSVPNLPYTDADFPDGSVADAGNFCRAPDGGDYLFCYVHKRSEPQWCDVPMDQNTKDCAYLDFMTKKWVPTYCDDVHDVVCEKPEEDLYRECSDSDETSCRELFEAYPEKCKDINLFWGSIRCRKTCGYCSDDNPLTTNTDTCSEPILDSSVTKVTVATSVAVGDYFEYSCPNDTKVVGNLKRGCQPDQTLTGINPSCIDIELANKWTSNVSMIERSYSNGNGTLWFGTTQKNTIQKNGYLTGWSYYSLNEATFAFYVLRKDANSNNYFVVNYTVVENVQSYRSTVFDLEPQNQFPVQSGDHIGWLMVSDIDKTGGIPYDSCVATHFPDDNGRVRQLTEVNNVHEPASYASFSTSVFTACRIYSFAARVGPNDWV